MNRQAGFTPHGTSPPYINVQEISEDTVRVTVRSPNSSDPLLMVSQPTAYIDLSKAEYRRFFANVEEQVFAPPADAYHVALKAWKENGGARPAKRPDGIPTRIDLQWHTPAEVAIGEAMRAVEAAGGSAALTDAVTLLSQARDRVADHVEGRPEPAA